MKNDIIYLVNVLKSIVLIKKYTYKKDINFFKKSIITQDAVSKRLEEIGENMKKISKETKHNNKEIEWKVYEEVRNFLTHVYSKVNNNRLWDIVKNDIPKLENQILKIKQSIEIK